MIPRFVWVTAAAIVVAVVLIVAGFFYARDAAFRQCERTVEARADSRAMWEYLINQAEEPDSPRVVEFVKEMDRRLPALKCEGVRWVPAEKGR
jgi:hypothetical protein